MDLRLYELTFVLDPQLEQTQIDENVQKIETMITDAKGEIVKKDLWGKRRLAYEIKKRQYGYYVYIKGKKADFGGLHIPLETSKKRAEDFVKLLQEQNNAKHLDAGTSLES